MSVADPGFPVGGMHPLGGGMDLQRGHFLVKMYAKMKELGPIGGRAPDTPPRSANDSNVLVLTISRTMLYILTYILY